MATWRTAPSRGCCPTSSTLPDIAVAFADKPNHVREDGTEVFWPYLRDPETLARPWAVPGTPGLMHRVGGLEKEDGSGDISYTPENHGRMVDLRAAKVKGIAKDIPPVEVHGDDDAEVLVLGWGSTWGTIDAAVGSGSRHRQEGRARAPRAPEPVPGEPRRGGAAVSAAWSSPR